MSKKMILLLVPMILFASLLGAEINILHPFTGNYADGMFPSGSLIRTGTVLFGMTPEGGSGNKGTVFMIGTDGGEYIVLHDFLGGSEDGASPRGDLLLAEQTLYGMTWAGGDGNRGVIFKMRTDGTGFALLHEFAGGGDDGCVPHGSLIISGSTLFGMTSGGGDDNDGTIFRIQTDGSGFSLLHEFTDCAEDGAAPKGSLILAGSTLYGMTEGGGASLAGTIFSIQTDGSGFTILHSFMGPDGRSPVSSLLLSGSTLYGTCREGGKIDSPGTIFKLGTDGTGFSILHVFGDGIIIVGEPEAGGLPTGALVLSGSTLYGMAQTGGTLDHGAIFEIQTDGSGFTLLHSFAYGSEDGNWPVGSLCLSGSSLIGMTNRGGSSSMGTIFSFALPGRIMVASPNGGEYWAIGSLHDITWDTEGFVGGVDIDYSTDGGNGWTPVVAATDNDGSYAWTVPDTLSPSCLVRISSVVSPAISDASDAAFSISAPFISVTSPNGGESWQRGTVHNIAWTSAGVTYVKIQLLKGTAVCSTIASSTPASSDFFSWSIPAAQPVGTDYRIRIVDKTAASRSDRSDGGFAIFAPAISIVSPASGAVWAKGTVRTISWDPKGTMDPHVRIQLYQDASKKLDIALSTENDGAFDWSIPASLAKGIYTIRIATLDSTIKARSKPFSIINGSIAVTTPATGTRWIRGTQQAITWTGEGTLTPQVKIQLLRGAELQATLAEATLNNGRYDWSIPVTQAVANNYKIRVSCIGNPVKGISDGFAISAGDE